MKILQSTIGSPASVIACVYQLPSSCSDAFCNEFFNLLEYLSSVSQNFLICGDFNTHVDTTSKDREKYLNCLETCNINQHVHKPTHLHGHILDLILTPDESSVVSNVLVSEFISDHALVLVHLDFYQTFYTLVQKCYLLEASQDKNIQFEE